MTGSTYTYLKQTKKGKLEQGNQVSYKSKYKCGSVELALNSILRSCYHLSESGPQAPICSIHYSLRFAETGVLKRLHFECHRQKTNIGEEGIMGPSDL